MSLAVPGTGSHEQQNMIFINARVQNKRNTSKMSIPQIQIN